MVAALYVGGGLAPVLALVDRLLDEAFARAAEGSIDRDYKTQLQELAQGRFRSSPRYRVVAERGPDHEKVFEVELELRGEALGRGTGRSKKDAEQGAARVALERLGEGGAGQTELPDGAESGSCAHPEQSAAEPTGALAPPPELSADVPGDALP